jgi:hypothetical protein
MNTPSLPQRKLSQDTVFTNLKDGDRVVVLRTPLDEPVPEKRNGTAGLATLAAAVADHLPGGLPSPNNSKSLVKEFRFFRKVDRDNDPDGYGGACFETDLDWSKCCTLTVCKIEKYRTSDTEDLRRQDLECVYDPAPTDPTHLAYVDGSFTGLRNPCKFVPIATDFYTKAESNALVANRLYRGGREIILASDADLNMVVQAGDEVHLRRLVSLAQLSLRSATYYTYGLPHRFEIITDLGQSVQAKILGGMSPRDEARRTVVLSGAGTELVLEADLHLVANSGNSVTLSNSAVLRHTGRLSAYGNLAFGAVLANTSRYYHSGRSYFGGSTGLKMSGTTYAEMRETEPATFNFRPAIMLSESAQVDWYGGVHMELNLGYAGKQIAQLSDNSKLWLHTGRYDNSDTLAFALDGTSTLEVSSTVTVDGQVGGLAYGPANANLLRHAGAQLLGSLAGGIVITELASDLPATGTGTAYVAGEGIDINSNVIKATGFGGLRADLTISANGTVAWDAGGRYQDFRTLRLESNATLLPPTNVPAGASGFLRVLQPSGGGRTLMPPSGATSQVPVGFGVNSTSNALVALVGFVFDGTNFYWNVTRYN